MDGTGELRVGRSSVLDRPGELDGPEELEDLEGLDGQGGPGEMEELNGLKELDGRRTGQA